MNKARRKELESISSQISAAKAEVDAVAEGEQEAFENLPENMQYSERGEAMEENVSELEEIASELEDLMSRIDDIINK